MKRVFIIHGWEADPESNWFPWLKKELEKKGFAAVVPAMPNSAHPDCAEWVAYLKKIVGRVDKDTFFIGHSLGAITILNYLNDLAAGEKVGKAILISGSNKNPGFPKLASFFSVPMDIAKIRQTSDSFTVIHSDDDPVVPIEMGKEMSDALQAEFITVHEGGHLNTGNGFFEFPLVLEKILEQ